MEGPAALLVGHRLGVGLARVTGGTSCQGFAPVLLHTPRRPALPPGARPDASQSRGPRRGDPCCFRPAGVCPLLSIFILSPYLLTLTITQVCEKGKKKTASVSSRRRGGLRGQQGGCAGGRLRDSDGGSRVCGPERPLCPPSCFRFSRAHTVHRVPECLGFEARLLSALRPSRPWLSAHLQPQVAEHACQYRFAGG